MSSTNFLADVEQHLSQRRFREAANLLVSAAEAGNADALYTFATWKISGQIVRRDTTAARRLMERAATAGHRDAALLIAHFRANGTGGPSDWKAARTNLTDIAYRDPSAAEQLRLLQLMDMNEDGDPATPTRLQVLSEVPLVRTAPHFLTDEECDYLVSKGAPRMTPSTVTDRATGRVMPHPVRRSDGAFFGVTNEDLVVNAINRRIAAAGGTRPEQGEPLQLLRYGPGGEFRPHFDFVKEGGNQRIQTALVYLSDDYEGGETRFLRINLDFRGSKGDLLLFRNVTSNGRPEPLAEHAGLPVRSGIKIVASRWIWRDPPAYPPPTPILADL